MIEKIEGGNDDFGRLGPELREHSQRLKEIIGGEEGDLAARHEELSLTLGGTLEELRTTDTALFLFIAQVAAAEPPEDAQQFVDANLTAPEDSPLRQRLIYGLSGEPRVRELVQLLKDIEQLVTAS